MATPDSSQHSRPTGNAVAAALPGWRRELAQLGGPNTLLWYREQRSGTLDLSVAHPGGIAKLLSGHVTRLSELVREPGAFRAAVARARAIRDASIDLASEFSLSTSFLAIGMARWTLPEVPHRPSAPVLLRSVRLEPVDISHDDFVVDLGHDCQLNPVLAHYLRTEEGIAIDADYIAGLSHAQFGFDPRPAYDELQALCGGIQGFTVSPQLVLSTFPWAKLGYVADLDRGFTRHPLVAALAGDAEAARTAGEPAGPKGEVKAGRGGSSRRYAERRASREGRVAHEFASIDESLVLDADDDQRQVVQDAVEGRSFVVDGLPGTGRTQTIANVVAAQIARGRSVLVVSHRRSAMRSLHRRLHHVGLRNRTLDVREDVPGRLDAAAQVGAALADGRVPADPSAGGDGRAELVQRDADALERFSECTHMPRQPWGVSVVDGELAVAGLTRRPRPPHARARIDAETLQGITQEDRDAAATMLEEAAHSGAWAGGSGKDPWYGARLTSDDDARRAREVIERISGDHLQDEVTRLRAACAEVDLSPPASVSQWRALIDLWQGVAATLATFRPAVFDAPLGDMAFVHGGGSSGAQEDPGRMGRARLRRQARELLQPGATPQDLGAALVAARDQRSAWVRLSVGAVRPRPPEDLPQLVEALEPIESDLRWLSAVISRTAGGGDLLDMHLDVLVRRLKKLGARSDRLEVVPRVHEPLAKAEQMGFGPVIAELAQRGASADEVAAEVEYVWWMSFLRAMGEQDPVYGEHDGEMLRRISRRYLVGDRAMLTDAAERVAGEVRRRAVVECHANPDQVGRLTSTFVEAEAPRSVPVALASAPDVLPALVPCWTTSPLAVASVVPPGFTFDTVIIDQADRVSPAEAVSTLARGRQVIAFGDLAGPGPRSFHFGADHRPTPRRAIDARSVGSQLAKALPVRRLGTHYRSHDERLVLAAHRAKGREDVQTFPGVMTGSPVTLRSVPGFEEPTRLRRGVVEALAEHVRSRPGQSLTIMAPTHDGALALRAAVREALAHRPELAAWVNEGEGEPLVVASVERVAGGVRDVAMVALTPQDVEPGGPLDGDGGRLLAATALSCSRRSTVVVGPSKDDLKPGVEGAGVLREAVTDSASVSEGEPVNELMADLADRLRRERLTVRARYGSGSRPIDLVVDDPERPGHPLVAVESDTGPTGGVRDVQRLRVEQLTRLGWMPVRVLSTDLFRDPARDTARIVRAAREGSQARAARRRGRG